MNLVVCLGHRILHPAPVLGFSKYAFRLLGEILSSQIEKRLGKKVVQLYRSTRLNTNGQHRP